ncbi:MAG: hypothetical protein OXC02_05380 [Rhodobacteraceae bacterium]|nr:hypothetical protein [Paracoccaceae bacterium]
MSFNTSDFDSQKRNAIMWGQVRIDAYDLLNSHNYGHRSYCLSK